MIEPAYLRDGAVMIRPFEAMDIEPHYEAALESVDAVYPWLPWCRPGYSRDYSKAWIETRAYEWEQGISCDFCIADARDGTLLGGCAINHINRENNFANLGYWVRTSRARRGVATSASRLVVRFGFETLRLNRIEIVVAVGNGPSQRVAMKLGALREGICRNRVITANGISDAVMFSLVPGDMDRWRKPAGIDT